MLLKRCKFYVLLVIIAFVNGQRLDKLTYKQRSRIIQKHNAKNKTRTVFENKTDYLFKIIHGRPENKDIEFKPCEIGSLKMPDFRAPDLRISDVKCLEHLWKIRYYDESLISTVLCESVQNVTLLNANFGGYDSIPGEFPHMGAIGWATNNDTWLFMCEGALVSEKYMLTAAHCSQLPKTDNRVSDLFPKVVRFGEPNISDKEQIGKSPTDVLIQRFIVHPNYVSTKKYYDIAIVELQSEIVFSTKVHPSCIWNNYYDVTGKVELTGWNTIESNKSVSQKEFISDSFDVFTRLNLAQKITPQERHKNDSVSNPVMQLAEVHLMDLLKCDRCTKHKRNRSWKGLLFHQMCAGRPPKNDSCQVDIGGVLQARLVIPEYTDWKIHYILGVRSFGFGCNFPITLSVYSKASSFIDWIEDTVWGSSSVERNNATEHSST